MSPGSSGGCLNQKMPTIDVIEFIKAYKMIFSVFPAFLLVELQPIVALGLLEACYIPMPLRRHSFSLIIII
jgi:hypothetical protein